MKKHNLVRIFSLLLAVVCCLPLLYACTDKTGPDDTSAPEDTEGTGAVIGGIDFSKPKEPIAIFSGNKTRYILVRPDDYPADLIDIFQSVTRKFRDELGINIECATDWHKADVDVSGKTEVLIGNCDREETKQVMSMLGINDYAVVAVGSKIVVAAYTPNKLREAVSYLNAHIKTEKTDDGVTLLFEDNVLSRGEAEKSLLIPDAAALAEYTIVYPSGDSVLAAAAHKLLTKLKKTFDVELTVKEDSAKRQGPEIVIGNCARECVKRLVGAQSVLDSVVVADSEGRDLLIVAGSVPGTANAVDGFIADFVNRYYADVLMIPENYKKDGDAYKLDSVSELAEGAEIRIMSFNLLCELWNDKPPIEGRDERAMALFTYYAPDVAGIQEVSDKWYSALDKQFKGLYAFTDRKTERNQTNFSTLIYNTEKVKLIEHGTKVFSQGNDPKLRLATWGVFEKLDSGKRFVAVSTHWDLGKNPQYQKVHSDEMAQICLELRKKYNVPVITTGDYNSNESSEFIKNFLSKTEFIDSKYTAATVKHNCKTYHDLGKPVSTAKAECIDHIFASDDVEFLFYNVEVSALATDTSDHNPIYADLRLK